MSIGRYEYFFFISQQYDSGGGPCMAPVAWGEEGVACVEEADVLMEIHE
jgi:hypothetical protein